MGFDMKFGWNARFGIYIIHGLVQYAIVHFDNLKGEFKQVRAVCF